MAKLGGKGVSPQADRTGREEQLIATILQMVEPTNQLAPDLGSRVPAVAVGVLRTEEPEDESQWRCKVPTCSGSCHPRMPAVPPDASRGERGASGSLRSL